MARLGMTIALATSLTFLLPNWSTNSTIWSITGMISEINPQPVTLGAFLVDNRYSVVPSGSYQLCGGGARPKRVFLQWFFDERLPWVYKRMPYEFPVELVVFGVAVNYGKKLCQVETIFARYTGSGPAPSKVTGRDLLVFPDGD